jgi:hypothetical protein
MATHNGPAGTVAHVFCCSGKLSADIGVGWTGRFDSIPDRARSSGGESIPVLMRQLCVHSETKNAGDSFSNTLGIVEAFSGPYVSLADAIALGAIVAVEAW